MNCINCGAEVRDGKKFCSNCGAPVAQVLHCANCGAEIRPGEAFCTGCGTKVGSYGGSRPVPASGPAPVAPAERSRPSPSRAAGVEYKGIGPRFAAALIDGILWYAFAIFVASRIGATTAGAGSEGIELSFNLQGWPAALAYLAGAAYWVLLEGYLGATVGKLVLGIRVVDGSGRAPGLMPALIRNLLRIVDFLPLFYLLGVLLVATSGQKQRLGDRVAGTYVVSRRGAAAIRASGVEARGAGGAVAAVVIVVLALAGGGLFVWSQQGGSNAQLAGVVSGLPGQLAQSVKTARLPSVGSGQPAAAQPTGAARTSPTQPTAPTGASQSPTPAPTAAGQGQSELGGTWNASITVKSASLTGASEKDTQAFQTEFATIKDRPQTIKMEFAPASAEAGIVTIEGDKIPYTYKGSQLVFVFNPGPGTLTFEGRLSRKGTGYSMEGTFQGSGPESGGMLTISGVWSATKP